MAKERAAAPPDSFRPSFRPGGRPGGGPMGMIGSGEKAKNAKGALLRLAGYLRAYKKELTAVLFLVVAGTLANLGGTYLIKPVVDEIAKSAPDRGYIVKLLAFLCALYACGIAAQWTQGRLLASVSQKAVKAIRKELFVKMQLLPIAFFDAHTHGELMSRATNDIDTVSQTLSGSIAQIFSGVMTLAGTLIIMCAISLPLTLATVLIIPLMLLTTRLIIKKTRRLYKAQQRALGAMNSHIEETVSGLYAVKAFGREEEVKKTFSELNEGYRGKAMKAQILSSVLPPIMGMFNNLTYGVAAAVGGFLAVTAVWGAPKIGIGSVVVFLNYSAHFSRPINELASMLSGIQSALAGAERVFEIMDTPSEYQNEDALAELGEIKGEVELDNVSFGYDERRQVLKAVSLKAEAGQMVALVGPTGAGKTTIVNLLTRFYDIKEGKITIDGMDISAVKKNSLRRRIAIVLQDTHMFGETVRENIRYGKLGASDEDVESAARLAGAHEFITRLKNGYDTVLSDDAGNISQGQRQLLSIARAMLADPAILILDEATSSVDTRTELKIQEAMKSLMQGRTSFVIAHRLSTIREADMILVIDGGKIKERGTHRELIEQGGLYKKLYEGQFEFV